MYGVFYGHCVSSADCLVYGVPGAQMVYRLSSGRSVWYADCLVYGVESFTLHKLRLLFFHRSALQCRYLYRLHTLLLQSLCIGFKEKLLWTSKGGTALLEHACQCFVSFTFLRWKDYVDIPFKGGLMKNAEKKDIRS